MNNEVAIEDLFWVLSEGHNHNQVAVEDLFWVLDQPHNHSQVVTDSGSDRVGA
jgi:hypothetical protein